MMEFALCLHNCLICGVYSCPGPRHLPFARVHNLPLRGGPLTADGLQEARKPPTDKYQLLFLPIRYMRSLKLSKSSTSPLSLAFINLPTERWCLSMTLQDFLDQQPLAF
ncbi:hypothetical protein BDN72DRAFT_850612, partial [Pluteus cervinus]